MRRRRRARLARGHGDGGGPAPSVRGPVRGPAPRPRHDGHRERARRPDVPRPLPPLLEPARGGGAGRHHLDLDEEGGPPRRRPLGPRRLRAGAAEPAEARARLPDRRGTAEGRGFGTAGLRHGGGRPRPDVARGRAHRPRGRQDGRPAALGPRLGRHEHARPGALRRPVHENPAGDRGPRVEAAHLRDLRPGRLRRVDPPRVPRPLLRREPLHAGRGAVLLRDLDGHQRRPLLSQLPGGGLHPLLRRLGERERSRQGAAREALPLPLLHPRGRHSLVPRADRQRPRERDEPRLRRLGRPLRLAAAARGDAGLLDAGWRFLPGERQLA